MVSGDRTWGLPPPAPHPRAQFLLEEGTCSLSTCCLEMVLCPNCPATALALPRGLLLVFLPSGSAQLQVLPLLLQPVLSPDTLHSQSIFLGPGHL